MNHAGEHGAVSIYEAQLAQIGERHPDLTGWLRETLAHEKEHRAAFKEAMPSRAAKPCRALLVWSWGGWLLGTSSALLGRTGVLACTAAVERTVHAHLQQQIVYLTESDPALAAVVEGIQRDELDHLAYAEAHLGEGSILSGLLRPVVALATEALIALSTRGDSLRLRQALAQGAK